MNTKKQKSMVILVLVLGLLLPAFLTAVRITMHKSVWLVTSSWLAVLIFSVLLIIVIRSNKNTQVIKNDQSSSQL